MSTGTSYTAHRIRQISRFSSGLVAWGAMVSLLTGPLAAQFSDRPLAGDVAKRKLDQLRMDDTLLRSEISGAQIARQAEITRLEGRIQQLEERLRDTPPVPNTSQLAYILEFASAPLNSNHSPAASGTEPSATIHDPSSDTLPPPTAKSSQQTIQEILIRDFVLSVEIELMDARARVMEKSREVTSLERLSSKGLASAAQLELQLVNRRRAELQVERYEKQLAGLRTIYPNYFE